MKSCTRTLYRCRVCSYFNTPDIELAYIERHAIDLHMHESCMHVVVRVLHSRAFMLQSGLAISCKEINAVHVNGEYQGSNCISQGYSISQAMFNCDT